MNRLSVLVVVALACTGGAASARAQTSEPTDAGPPVGDAPPAPTLQEPVLDAQDAADAGPAATPAAPAAPAEASPHAAPAPVEDAPPTARQRPTATRGPGVPPPPRPRPPRTIEVVETNPMIGALSGGVGGAAGAMVGVLALGGASFGYATSVVSGAPAGTELAWTILMIGAAILTPSLAAFGAGAGLLLFAVEQQPDSWTDVAACSGASICATLACAGMIFSPYVGLSLGCGNVLGPLWSPGRAGPFERQPALSGSAGAFIGVVLGAFADIAGGVAMAPLVAGPQTSTLAAAVVGAEIGGVVGGLLGGAAGGAIAAATEARR